MSEFQELIKSFAKSREYVRDFFVYGFKTREDFEEKSGRTYDNERRRIESWLSPYIHSEYTKKGKTISLSIDSGLLPTNPLYRVWKSKSFTDNDIMLHFFLIDILQDGKPRSVDELTNEILLRYDVLFEPQIVRKKAKEYEAEGLFTSQKDGRQLKYQYSSHLSETLSTEFPELSEALQFFHIASPLGIIGSTIMDNQNITNGLFTMKHSFFVHTLEDEILLSALTAIHEQRAVRLTNRSAKSKQSEEMQGIPLKIFISTRTGRRYLCLYRKRIKRFTCLRLDYIKKLSLSDKIPEFADYQQKLEKNLPQVFGVSFGREHSLDTIKLTLFVDTKEEPFILDRLKREGRGGTITQIAENTYTYEVEVFDGNEMLPWIRTFTGRILSLESNNTYLTRTFYGDTKKMINLYCNDTEEGKQ